MGFGFRDLAIIGLRVVVQSGLPPVVIGAAPEIIDELFLMKFQDRGYPFGA